MSASASPHVKPRNLPPSGGEEVNISVISERDETLRAAHERQREVTETFMSLLSDQGYSTRRFDPAGQDTIGGGCGQLHYVQQ